MVKGNATITLVGASEREGFVALQHLYRYINRIGDVEVSIGFDPTLDGVDLHLEVLVPREDLLGPFAGLLMRELKQAWDGEAIFRPR